MPYQGGSRRGAPKRCAPCYAPPGERRPRRCAETDDFGGRVSSDPAWIAGYADINGLHLYYEVRGEEATPLVLLHGGVMTIELTYASLLPTLTQHHRVIGIDFQAHGRTADIDRDLTCATWRATSSPPTTSPSNAPT